MLGMVASVAAIVGWCRMSDRLPDQYALLRAAIREDDERDAAVRKLLRDKVRARAERDRAASYVGIDWQGVQGELDWTSELFFIEQEEAHLP